MQSNHFGPNFRKWSEFGLFPENQSEFGLNLLRKSDFFNFRWPTGPGKVSTDGFLGAPAGVNIFQNSPRITGEKFPIFGIWGKVR